MTSSKKKLLIVADDHPRIREALEYILAEFHDSTTVYTARDPQELRALTETRLAEADELTVADVSITDDGASRDEAQPPERQAPLMVVSMQKRGITANWFVSIPSEAVNDDDSRIEAALDQRRVVMDLIGSLREAALTPDEQMEDTQTIPSAERLMQLGLTQRQAEVLVWLAEGLTNKEIARKLDVSEWTIRHHVSAILMRLEVSNRGRAAIFARQLVN